MDNFLSVPFAPFDATESRLVSGNDGLVFKKEFARCRTVYLRFQPPTETQPFPSKTRVAWNQILPRRHQRLPDQPDDEENRCGAAVFLTFGGYPDLAARWYLPTKSRANERQHDTSGSKPAPIRFYPPRLPRPIPKPLR